MLGVTVNVNAVGDNVGENVGADVLGSILGVLDSTRDVG